jgi:site-specific DNA recombinase
MKRAVLYARVSSDDRQEEDRNLLGQLDMCRQYAQSRDYQIVAELHEDDRGASGAAFDLPQLNHVRDLACSGAFDVLIVRELDRLSRSLAKQLFVEHELRRRGVEIEYVLDRYPDTPEGNLVKHVKASIAEFERLKIAERAIRGRELQVKSGNVVLGIPPFGYRLVRCNNQWMLEINAAEAQIVRQIFRWYTEGDEDGVPIGTYRIHKRLHADKVPAPADLRDALHTKKRGAGDWNRGSIVRILENETYAGTWHWRKTTMRDGERVVAPKEQWMAVQVPAIVSPETWEAAVTRRLAAKSAREGNTASEQHLLARHVACKLCGATVSTHTKHTRTGTSFCYVCPARDRSRTQYSHTCDLPRFRGDQLEQTVWSWLRALLCDPVALREGISVLRAQAERKIAPLQERLQAVDRHIAEDLRERARLLDQYLAGTIEKSILHERKAACDAGVAALQQERTELVVQLKASTSNSPALEDLASFAIQVSDALAHANTAALRRSVIETLGVKVLLSVEESDRVAYVGCVLGEARLVVS